MRKPKVSVIYVNYKSSSDLLESIKSLISSKPKVSYEVIVVDNSPEDNVSDKLKQFKPKSKIKYLKAKTNLGYGAGNNLGTESAKGEYLLFLNPDTLIKKNTVDELVKFLDGNKKAAVVAPNLVVTKNNIFDDIGARELTPLRAIFSLSFIAKIFPRNKFKRKYRMQDLSKDKKRQAVAVPGSAFMIRKDVFNEVGKFDEKMFMYFEEADLGKRLKEAGYKSYIIPNSEVIHKWEQKGDKPEKLQEIFNKSRFYYFRKHYGYFTALFTEAFLRVSKNTLFITIVIMLGTLLRIYKIDEYVAFGGDNGYYITLARDVFLKNEFPLVSITTSVPIFRQGAIFVWMLSIVLKIFGYDPATAFYFVALINSLALLILYFVLKKYYSAKFAVISVVLASFSPLFVTHSRKLSVIAPIFLFTIISFWIFLRSINRNKNIYYFLFGLTLSILLQFELAAFNLFIVYGFVFLILRKKIRLQLLLSTILGMFLGMLPFIIYDLQRGVFIQTLGFFIWAATKPFESLMTIFNGRGTAIDIDQGIELFSRILVPQLPFFSVGILILSLLLFFLSNIKNIKEKQPKTIVISVWLAVTYLSFFARGIFSDAYMPLLFLPTVVSLSFFVVKLFDINKIAITLFIIVFVYMNSRYLIDTHFLFQDDPLTLKNRKAAANYIVKDADGRDYELSYIGYGLQWFIAGYEYDYLSWWYGNEPVKNSDLKYKLYQASEETFGITPPPNSVWIGKLAVEKVEK